MVNLINQDFDRRKQSINEEIKVLKDQLHGTPTAPSSDTGDGWGELKVH